MLLLELSAERRIAEASAAGAVDDLPGQGQALLPQYLARIEERLRAAPGERRET